MLPETELHEMCLVTLRESQMKKGGLFGITYISFTLITEDLGWKVDRKFKDFNWLRYVLHTCYPDYLVPLLPREVN